MTQRLFYNSDELTCEVEVLTCTAHEQGFVVTLKATPFHPQGGGQPFDTGWIGDSQVLRVMHEPDGIAHYLDRALPTGPALARVDAERRALHTRLHSAGHLIGHYGESQGWKALKAHHWPGESRVSFTRGEQPQTLDAGCIQQALDAWIKADKPRHLQVTETQRQVSFGDLPAYPCGGTHVRSLNEIGQVEILSISEKKGTLAISYRVN
ncbi:alanyl-tRNA editing protein [Pseudomonas gingeri]|uniref:Alanyl-tRNA editing protein n=1 Tax=Pseudomonas gingeri TaxID=117681 RepID=A0A7Y7XI65_9PSED|nr:alanyl-tRNA editing protein [Pseudomonas gingeri]NWC00344.1 alanyl-tRNA editing protein [Pseudomonas gingeri]